MGEPSDDVSIDSFLRRVAGAGGADSFAPLVRGQRVAGRYVVVDRVGEGGMGCVYSAVRTHDDALVAIKVVRPAAVADPEGRERFEREARAALSLSHPAVVRVLDYGLSAGLPFLVMPLLEGRTLRERLRREGALALATTTALLRPIVAALSEAHGLGVVHRDLKPENIWLEPDGDAERARLLDFGLASVPGPRITRTGVPLGTPRYMPPEQLRSARRCGPAADQYALAVVVYEMLAGRVPHDGVDVVGLAIQRRSPPPPMPEAVPAEVEAALRRALAPEPGDRFPDVEAFATAVFG